MTPIGQISAAFTFDVPYGGTHEANTAQSKPKYLDDENKVLQFPGQT